MRTHLKLAVFAAAMAFSGAASADKSAREVFAGVSRGVVVVIATTADGVNTSQGSGVVVGRNEVVTNCHVLSGASKVTVRQAADSRGRETWRMAAKPMARNEKRDLCLLFVNELSDPPAAVPVPFGDARDISIGDEVYAIGAPRGLELSLSRGVVSQLRGDYGKRSAPLIQTDAAISPGSSGGGLFNGMGELIGITSFKISGDGSEGISFAIPSEWVKELVLSVQERFVVERARAACFSAPTADCVFGMARAQADTVDGTHKRAGALVRIAQALARTGHDVSARATLADAMESTARIDQSNQKAETMAGIAVTLAKIGDETGARETFAVAIRIGGQVEDVPRRDRTLRRIAKAQVYVGFILGALKTIERMNETSTKWWVLEELAKLRAKAEDIEGALRIIKKIAAEDHRFHALKDLAETQAKAGNMPQALQVIKQIDDTKRRIIAMEGVINAQADARDEAEVEADFVDVIQFAKRIRDAYWRGRVLRAIAKAQAKAGSEAAATAALVDAIQAVDELQQYKAVAWSDIASVQAAIGDIAGALQTAKRIDRSYERNWALVAIAEAQAKTGNVVQSLETVGQIHDASHVRVVALKYIANVQASAGDVIGALRTVEKIYPSSKRDQILSDMVKGPAEAENIPGVFLIVGKIDAALWRNAALRNVARLQVEAGNVVGAVQTLKLNTEGSSPTKDDLALLAAAQGSAGDFSAAIKTINQIDDPVQRGWAAWSAIIGLQTLAQAEKGEEDWFYTATLGATRNVAGALQMATQIDDGPLRIGALIHIAVAIAGAE